jgi:hypothetical protein
MHHLWSQQMATKMAKFFCTTHTLGQFRREYPMVNVPDAISLAQRLVQENLLEFVVTWDSGGGEDKAYQTYHLPPEDDIRYGVIDCLAFGFAYTRDRFKGSVIPLLVNEKELGTGFLIEGNLILTAGHCSYGWPLLNRSRAARAPKAGRIGGT